MQHRQWAYSPVFGKSSHNTQCVYTLTTSSEGTVASLFKQWIATGMWCTSTNSCKQKKELIHGCWFRSDSQTMWTRSTSNYGWCCFVIFGDPPFVFVSVYRFLHVCGRLSVWHWGEGQVSAASHEGEWHSLYRLQLSPHKPWRLQPRHPQRPGEGNENKRDRTECMPSKQSGLTLFLLRH